jgi:hypothetical protein
MAIARGAFFRHHLRPCKHAVKRPLAPIHSRALACPSDCTRFATAPRRPCSVSVPVGLSMAFQVAIGASGLSVTRIAGTSALAVDAVGAAVMGFESASIRHLELAVKRGYGTNESYSIWTRGVEIDEVKADFTKP